MKSGVFDATLMFTVLYGCESWLNGGLNPVIKTYNWGIKQLLECAYHNLKWIMIFGTSVATRTCSCYALLLFLFFSRGRWRERRERNNDPWSYAVMKGNVPTGRFISYFISPEKDGVDEAVGNLRAPVPASISRRMTYVYPNTDFTFHDIWHENFSIIYTTDNHSPSYVCPGIN